MKLKDLLRHFSERVRAISAKLFLHRMDCGRFTEKNEHRTSNVQHRMLNGKAEETEFKKPELLNDILEETEELIKIFVTSIKTAGRQAHGPKLSRRAEKKQK